MYLIHNVFDYLLFETLEDLNSQGWVYQDAATWMSNRRTNRYKGSNSDEKLKVFSQKEKHNVK